MNVYVYVYLSVVRKTVNIKAKSEVKSGQCRKVSTPSVPVCLV